MSKTKRIEALLCKGYLPRELPPPFATASFKGKSKKILKEFETAKLLLSNKEQENFPFASHPAIFDMARRGHARRLLSIPNPVNQLYLAIEIVEHWDAIVTAIDRSNLSITKV